MSGIKRFTLDYMPPREIEEHKDGEYVLYKDYMRLLTEYHDERVLFQHHRKMNERYAEDRRVLIASLRLVPQFVTIAAARDFVRDKLKEVCNAS